MTMMDVKTLQLGCRRRARLGWVVGEVGESVADPLEAFDHVVEGFGGSITHSGDVEIADLVEPGVEAPRLNTVPDPR